MLSGRGRYYLFAAFFALCMLGAVMARRVMTDGSSTSGRSQVVGPQVHVGVKLYYGDYIHTGQGSSLPGAMADAGMAEAGMGNRKSDSFFLTSDIEKIVASTDMGCSLISTDLRFLKGLSFGHLTLIDFSRAEIEGGVIPTLPSVEFNEPDGAFPYAQAIRLSSSVTELEAATFHRRWNLVELSAPGVRVIGKHAFKGCTSLRVTNFASLREVGEEAFSDCSSLKELVLPEVEALGDRAFVGCGNLCTLVLPSARWLGEKVFSGCGKLSAILLGAPLPAISAATFDGFASNDVQIYTDAPSVLQSRGYPRKKSFLPSARFSLHSSRLPDLVATGDLDTLRMLLDAGANVNATDVDGTPLTELAIRFDRVEILKLLIGAGADVNARNRDGQTPMFAALLRDNPQYFHILKKAGARLDVVDRRGNTLLHQMVYRDTVPRYRQDNEVILNALIAAAPDIDAKNSDGRTPFQLVKWSSQHYIKDALLMAGTRAVQSKEDISREFYESLEWENFDLARLLLKRGADVNYRAPSSPRGMTNGTPLNVIITRGQEEFYKLVMAAGADPGLASVYGVTPLMAASRSGHAGIVTDLLRAGVDIGVKDDEGRTALHHATSPEVVDLLVIAGSDLDATDKQGRTPLHGTETPELADALVRAGVRVDVRAGKKGSTPLHDAASEYGFPEVVKILIRAGADVNAGDLDGCPPLHYAYEPETAKFLLEAGADVDAGDLRKRTALHHAAWRPEVVRVLLDAGADVHAEDETGKTALHYTGVPEAAEILIRAGADVNARDADGHTPLDYARQYKSTPIAEYLQNRGARPGQDGF